MRLVCGLLAVATAVVGARLAEARRFPAPAAAEEECATNRVLEYPADQAVGPLVP